jgi:hypothetical protein
MAAKHIRCCVITLLFAWGSAPISAQVPGELNHDSLPPFFSRIAFFQISFGVPVSGTAAAMEDRMTTAGFNRTGYNMGLGRNTTFPRRTGSLWVQFDVGGVIDQNWAAGLMFGTSNNQTVQGNIDTSGLPRLLLFKSSDVYIMPYVRRSVYQGKLQYKLGIGLHRLALNAPVVGVENRGKEQVSKPGVLMGVALRMVSLGNSALRLSAEYHWVGNAVSGAYRINAGAVGNVPEISIPGFSVPLSHLNIGLRLDLGHP